MIKLYSTPKKSLLYKENFKRHFIADPLRKLSRQNALKDYRSLLEHPDSALWSLHSELEDIRHEGTRNYEHYDYGSGYYYQSMRRIGISGYRNTEERIEKLGLRRMLEGRTVLDIGSNSGFLLLSLSEEISRGTGIEFNPYLVRTADAVKHHLGANNVEFLCTSFEDYTETDGAFDAVLSLANHSTFDGNTKQDITAYFAKCSTLLSAGGLLIFESHPPKIEPADKLQQTIRIISDHFEIIDRPSVEMLGFLDRGRTYIVAKKP